MCKKESVWLYVKGDEYAGMMFESSLNKEEVYREMLEEGVENKTIEVDGTCIEIEILRFKEVDSKFESFVKNNLCDYDMLKNENIYRVELKEDCEEEYEEEEDDEEGLVNMELGNLMFGNSRGEYPIERGIWQDTFVEFLDEIGLDGYGYLEDEKLKEYETDRGGFENDVFLINPYYWGDDDDIASEHNFIYKPTGYELDWYKYPLRDSYANKKLTLEEFKDMLNKCKESVKK